MEGVEQKMKVMFQMLMSDEMSKLQKEITALKDELNAANNKIKDMEKERETQQDPWQRWGPRPRENEDHAPKAMPSSPMVHGKMATDFRDDKRKREMVMRGVPRNTPKNEVIAKMNHIISLAKIETEVPPFTIGPMVSFGIVRFPDSGRKFAFKEWLKDNQEVMKHEQVYVSENVEKSQRTLEIAAGKVKKVLCQKREGRRDVTVDWRRGQVFVGRVLVAKWLDGKMVLLSGEVLKMRDEVDASIKQVGVETVEVVLEPVSC